MRTFYAVFDTNVLVSALMSKPQIGRQRESCEQPQSELRPLGAPCSRREIKPHAFGVDTFMHSRRWNALRGCFFYCITN